MHFVSVYRCHLVVLGRRWQIFDNAHCHPQDTLLILRPALETRNMRFRYEVNRTHDC